MAELTRFSLDSGQMDSDGDGSWVRYEDVQELLKELEEKTEALRVAASYSQEPWAQNDAKKLLQKYNNI